MIGPNQIAAYRQRYVTARPVAQPSQAEADELLALFNAGQWARMRARARKFARRHPAHAFGWKILGVALRKLGKLPEAVNAMARAVELAPGDAEVHSNLGDALRELGKFTAAEAVLRSAIAINPDWAAAHLNLGIVHYELGRAEEAEVSFRRVIAAKPDFAEAYCNLGCVLRDAGRMEEADASYRRAIAINPLYAEAHANLGNVLRDLGRLDEAEASHRCAIAITPDFFGAHANLGNVLQDRGRLDEAEASFRCAIAMKSDYAEAHYNMALTLLAAGRVRKGLDEYEWRWKTPTFKTMARTDNFGPHQWDGTADIDGKTILVWGEQGVGDQIIWSALLPEIIARARHCIVECAPKLAPLLARSFPGADVRPTDRTSDPSRTDFDYHVPMGSLFRVLGATSPRTDVYLFPDPERVAFWKARLAALGDGIKVGIALSGSRITPIRAMGYTRIADWAPVFATPGAVFVNLQHGDCVADMAEANARFGVTVHDFADLDLFNDLAEVAALAAVLDVGICVGTAVAAIVAGVGTPLWRLTWRQDATNNVLYTPPGPSVDYYYRDTGESWGAAFVDVARDLDEFAKNSNVWHADTAGRSG